MSREFTNTILVTLDMDELSFLPISQETQLTFEICHEFLMKFGVNGFLQSFRKTSLGILELSTFKMLFEREEDCTLIHAIQAKKGLTHLIEF